MVSQPPMLREMTVQQLAAGKDDLRPEQGSDLMGFGPAIVGGEAELAPALQRTA